MSAEPIYLTPEQRAFLIGLLESTDEWTEVNDAPSILRTAFKNGVNSLLEAVKAGGL